MPQVVGFTLAGCGFLYQVTTGFELPFPLNLVFLPLTAVEWLLRWRSLEIPLLPAPPLSASDPNLPAADGERSSLTASGSRAGGKSTLLTRGCSFESSLSSARSRRVEIDLAYAPFVGRASPWQDTSLCARMAGVVHRAAQPRPTDL